MNEKMRELLARAADVLQADAAPGVRDAMAREIREALAEQLAQGEANRLPEDVAEQFIQAAIDRAPEPLRRLGEYLTHVLDEDQWETAESMLLGVAEKPKQDVPQGWKLVPIELTRRLERAFWDNSKDGAYQTWNALLAAAPEPPA